MLIDKAEVVLLDLGLRSQSSLRLVQHVKKSSPSARIIVEVIDGIAEGLSNKEIAEQLNIAVHTVKSHVHNILEKLALHTRLEIASFARRGKTSRPRDS